MRQSFFALAILVGFFFVIANGAGAGARNNMGIAVVGGMTFATVIGIFLIPVFYVIVEKLAAKFRGGATRKTGEQV